MDIKIGDTVKSYDFVMGGELLTDKAYVIGTIIDIAPVDWCGDNCDHYHIKIVERFDAYGKSIEGPDDWMVFPPVYDSIVVLSNWPNDELEAESMYDFVTSLNRTCAFCGGLPKFMIYDLPTGPHAFCSEKHYTRFVGLEEKPTGWYGYDAETGSELPDCGVCGTSVIILNDDYGTCPKCETFWNLVNLQDLWDSADGDIKVLDAENWGGDPEGPLAKALAKAREEAKKPKKTLKIEKLSAESNQKFRREAILFGIGIVSAITGTVLAEILIDRYREDPELLDTPVPKENA